MGMFNVQSHLHNMIKGRNEKCKSLFNNWTEHTISEWWGAMIEISINIIGERHIQDTKYLNLHGKKVIERELRI